MKKYTGCFFERVSIAYLKEIKIVNLMISCHARLKEIYLRFKNNKRQYYFI